MHIRLREVPLRILTTEKTTWIASTHVIFHKTFKLFWKFPLQQTASKQQQGTLKGFLWSTRRASGANSHFCVRIFFFIPRCHEKELIAVFKLPTRNARELCTKNIMFHAYLISLERKLLANLKLSKHILIFILICIRTILLILKYCNLFSIIWVNILHRNRKNYVTNPCCVTNFRMLCLL